MSKSVATENRWGVNPSMLAYARTRAALSLPEAAMRLSKILKAPWKDSREWTVTEADIQAWESGTRPLNSSQVWAVCKVYMYPYSGLVQDTPIIEPSTDFRASPGGERRPLGYESRRQLHRFDRYYELAEELGGRLGASETFDVPIAGRRDTSQIASMIRSALRVDEATQASWHGDDQAFEQWKRRIEDLGVYVFSLPLEVRELRGASRWDAGGPPAILAGTSDPPTAKSFTLIHEFAHLADADNRNALCDPTVEDHATERRVNQIAAQTLVPAEWARRETSSSPKGMAFKEWPLQERQRLRAVFNVSNQMLGNRLTELGITSSNGYANTDWPTGRLAFGRGGGKGLTKAERFRRYLGQPLVGMLRRALEVNAVGEGEVLKHWLDELKLDDLWNVVQHDDS